MRRENEISKLFLRDKPSKILLGIKRRNDNDEEEYALKLAKNAGATYAHTVRVLQRMEELNLIDYERDGRKKLVHLTNLGDNLAEHLLSFWHTSEKYNKSTA